VPIRGYHEFSKKRPRRYVDEFAGRHDVGLMDTIDRMGGAIARMVRKRLRYREPLADNELSSGARTA